MYGTTDLSAIFCLHSDCSIPIFVEDSCRLYVGGITRNIVPENAAAVERDIRSEFESKFVCSMMIHLYSYCSSVFLFFF